jgi:transcriptional regulator with XRE-family HTH domain
MPRKPPPPLGLTLTILRSAQGWSQKDLAAATGLSRSVLSEYETGATELARDRLEALAAALRWPPGSVDRVLFGLGLMQPAPAAYVSPLDPDEEERRIIDQAAAVGARETAEALRAQLLGELRQEKVRRARQNANDLWLTLKPLPHAERRRLVTEKSKYHDAFLCECLCAESVKAAASDADRARRLAELALHIAERVPGPSAWLPRLKGYVWAFIGNARRVFNDLPAADAAFVQAWALWREGTGGSDLLEEARLLDLESSLRRDQRRFTEALELHDQTLAVANPEEVGQFLLNKAFTLEQSGDFERSIETLEEAERSVPSKQPRLLCVLRFNQAVNLVHLGRLVEAEPRLAQARELAVQLGNEVDLLRLLWLEGRVSAGRGEQREAAAAFEQVRREFAARDMAYDYALVSLELAALYLEEERTSEVQALAQQMVWIFKAQRVHREALAALKLFREGAEKEELTMEMIRRLLGYLTKARHYPELQFEA